MLPPNIGRKQKHALADGEPTRGAAANLPEWVILAAGAPRGRAQPRQELLALPLEGRELGFGRRLSDPLDDGRLQPCPLLCRQRKPVKTICGI
jgi:hypothetical protein